MKLYRFPINKDIKTYVKYLKKFNIEIVIDLRKSEFIFDKVYNPNNLTTILNKHSIRYLKYPYNMGLDNLFFFIECHRFNNVCFIGKLKSDIDIKFIQLYSCFLNDDLLYYKDNGKLKRITIPF